MCREHPDGGETAAADITRGGEKNLEPNEVTNVSSKESQIGSHLLLERGKLSSFFYSPA